MLLNMEDYLQTLSKEMNETNAIKNTVSTILPDILNMLGKTELSRLASTHGLRGRSKMNKSQLATGIANSITNLENIINGALLMEDKEWDLLNEFISDNGPMGDNVLYESYVYAQAQGWLFSFYFNDNFSLIMPDEVRDAFAKLNLDNLNEKRQQYRFVLDYIHALVHLYGVVSVSDVYKVIQMQNPGLLSESEFLSIVDQMPQRQWSFDLYDNFFVDGSIEEQEQLDSLLAQIKDKPQYVPSKEQLLLYKEDSFFEMTPQLTALQNYVSRHLCNDTDMVTSLIDDIQLACSMERSLQDILGEFERRNIEFKDIEQVNTIVSLITEVMNNTRIWSNRGYTPAELNKLTEGETSVKPKQMPYRVLVNQQVTSVKIGRNEPCVCGSGKKYKKCCGNV